MKKIDLDFAEIEIGDGLVVCRVGQGVDVDQQSCERFKQAVAREVGGEYDLVLDMVNSYSMQLPAIYALRDDPDITRILAVCYRPATKTSMHQVFDMIKKPVTIVDSLEQAIELARKKPGLDVSA